MDWDKEKLLFFIELIRERLAIWDVECPDHKDRKKRYDAIEEISKIMNVSTKEVNTKWNSLRTQFNREKRKITDVSTGSGADAIYMTKWFAFNEMQTLMVCNKALQSASNFEIIQEDEPPTMPTPYPSTSALPPRTSTPKAVGSKKRRNSNSTMYEEALHTIRAIREKQKGITI